MQINHAQQIEKLLRVEGCTSQTTYVHISILTGGVSNFKKICQTVFDTIPCCS